MVEEEIDFSAEANKIREKAHFIETPLDPKAKAVWEWANEWKVSPSDAKDAYEKRNGNKEFAKEYLDRRHLAAVMPDTVRYPKWNNYLKDLRSEGL